MDFKQRWAGRVSSHSLVEIQLKCYKIRGHSFICTLQCILLPCDTVCDSAVCRMTAHDICANSAHDSVCEQLMDAHNIYANSAHGICANSKWLLTTSVQIALTQKGRAALWVTNGCTSMSKPITELPITMGVDNNLLSPCTPCLKLLDCKVFEKTVIQTYYGKKGKRINKQKNTKSLATLGYRGCFKSTVWSLTTAQ